MSDVVTDNLVEDPAPNTDTQEVDKSAEKTILEGADDTPIAAPVDWPEDWRSKLGADDKEAKRLERFKSPKDIFAAYRNLEKKMSEGPQRAQAPDGDATDDDIAAYRKENGIPETPEGYLEKLPDGIVIGDDDKPILDSFLQSAHAKHRDPATVSDSIAWYYELQEQESSAQVEADRKVQQETVEELRAEWGGEYRANINSGLAYLKTTAGTTADGDPVSDLILGARLADGTTFGDNPHTLRWLVRQADEANPSGFVAPGEGGSQAKSVDDEINEIKKFMRTNRRDYDKDTAKQERFAKLLEAQAKFKERSV